MKMGNYGDLDQICAFEVGAGIILENIDFFCFQTL